MCACGANPVSSRLRRSCCTGDTTNFLNEKVAHRESFILIIFFSGKKKVIFLVSNGQWNLEDKVESPVSNSAFRVAFQSVSFETGNRKFSLFHLSLLVRAVRWFMSWSLAFLPFPHFISPLFSPTAGKLSSRNRSIKTMTPRYLMTCPAQMKFQLEKNQERREEWNWWFIRNKLLRGQHLHFHSSWTKITFLICFTPKCPSSQGTFFNRNYLTLIFWQDFPVHFFSPWSLTNAGQ